MQIWASQIDFNPRSHEGSDQMQLHRVLWWKISIHAPTRGATLTNQKCCFIVKNFNPRSHEGSDCPDRRYRLFRLRFQSTLPRGERRTKGGTYVVEIRFQSTLPRGERPNPFCFFSVFINFNPRSHEGSDNMLHTPCVRDVISIHAPTRGATALYTLNQCSLRFQSTLPRGERHALFVSNMPDLIFQSTLPRGERRQ